MSNRRTVCRTDPRNCSCETLLTIFNLHFQSILMWKEGVGDCGEAAGVRGGDGRSGRLEGRGHGVRGQGLAQGQGDSRVSVQGGLGLRPWTGSIPLENLSDPSLRSFLLLLLLLFPFSAALSGYNFSAFHSLFLSSALFTL